jgi:hypothetical protein
MLDQNFCGRQGCAPGNCGATRSVPKSTGERRKVMSVTEVKQQLVDCIRMLEQSDIIDYNGHCSIRLDDGHILINIGSCQRSRLTVDDICAIDIEANQIDGRDKAPLERHLHCVQDCG